MEEPGEQCTIVFALMLRDLLVVWFFFGGGGGEGVA
jgi:hypothetical protein